MTEETTKGCPVCGSHSINGTEVDIVGDTAVQEQGCNDCESSWTATYLLANRKITERGPNHPLDARALLKLAFARIPNLGLEIYYEGDVPAGLRGQTLTIDDLDRVMSEVEACDMTVIWLMLQPGGEVKSTSVGTVVVINSNSPEEQIADHSCGVLMKTFFPELEID